MAMKMIAVTIGIGEPWMLMASLAAESVRRRTGLETFILNETTAEKYGVAKPHHLKFHLFDEFPEAESILYFDADTVFLQEWNPRDYGGKQEIVCVRDRWDSDYIQDDAKEIGMAPKHYFNSGLFIISRAHHQSMLKLARSLHGQLSGRFPDRTALNAARARLEIPAIFLPVEYNCPDFDGMGCRQTAYTRIVVIGHCNNTVAKPTEEIEAYYRFWMDKGVGQRAEDPSRRTDRSNLALPPEGMQHREMLEQFLAGDHPFPAERFEGRGIVICGGGAKYFPCVWVCLNMLRHQGCRLPVEIWHLGPEEMTPSMRALVEPLGATCVDGRQVREQHPVRALNGWELKAFALLHCRFAEVLLLDADNVVVKDPEYLFDDPGYREHGAILWPDYGRLGHERSIWKITGVEYRDEPEVESGQLLVNKAVCWKPLQAAMHLNEHSDFYYRHIHGDKETFHFGWRKSNQSYAMPARGIHTLDATMCQHDLQGERIFQHRNFDKWKVGGGNRRIAGFLFEDECFEYLRELKDNWPDMGNGVTFYREDCKSEAERAVARRLVSEEYHYERVGHDQRKMTFLRDGRVGIGADGCEVFWDVKASENQVALEVYSGNGITMSLTEDEPGLWKGRWVNFEKMPVELRPLKSKPESEALPVCC